MLRDYQIKLMDDIFNSWNDHNAVVAVSPTGSGKTVIMASIAAKLQSHICAMAHRQELVGQISMAFAREGILHRIIASDNTVRSIIAGHIAEFGRNWHSHTSTVVVAGVDTLIARETQLMQWSNTVKYWMGDECHHFLSNNKWGTTVSRFKFAKGVGFTATPTRTDRKSLHIAQGGVFDDMVVGPSPRTLIDRGYLSEYRIYGPPQSINRDEIKKSAATGDFTQPALRDASHKSTITGDIVEHYLKLANGKQGITFVVDVDTAEKTAAAFREAGVPAEAVSAKTPDAVRNAVIGKFRKGLLKQLVNVDLFGEGFDVPAVEVVSMGRPTESFGLYMQQFGRALRVIDGKTHGIIIDHVGNVIRHGLPDRERVWKLFDENYGVRGKRRDDDSIPVTTCIKCFSAREALTKTCPFCGYVDEPDSRSEPKFVDGDLIEFDEELLAALRGKIEQIESDFVPIPDHLRGTPAGSRLVRLHGERQLAHTELKDTIAQWAGVRRDQGISDSEIYRRFFHMFGVDVATAQTLGRAEVDELTTKIKERYWK